MDEPDATLSFTACLGLVALLHDLVQLGSQAVVASSATGAGSSPSQAPTSATC